MDPDDLKALRKRAGLSQGAFAAQLGLSLRGYQDLESSATPIRRLHALAVGAVCLDLGLAARTDEAPDLDRNVMGDFLVEITRLQGRLLSAMKDGARNCGLEGASESMILHAVATAQTPPTAPRIARSLGYTRQAIHRVLERLERRGLIATVSNPQHKTARLLVATPAGLEMMERTRGESTDWMTRVTAKVPMVELAPAVDILTRVRRALETPRRDMGGI